VETLDNLQRQEKLHEDRVHEHSKSPAIKVPACLPFWRSSATTLDRGAT
jgi:hypothetical protein